MNEWIAQTRTPSRNIKRIFPFRQTIKCLLHFASSPPPRRENVKSVWAILCSLATWWVMHRLSVTCDVQYVRSTVFALALCKRRLKSHTKKCRIAYWSRHIVNGFSTKSCKQKTKKQKLHSDCWPANWSESISYLPQLLMRQFICFFFLFDCKKIPVSMNGIHKLTPYYIWWIVRVWMCLSFRRTDWRPLSKHPRHAWWRTISFSQFTHFKKHSSKGGNLEFVLWH